MTRKVILETSTIIDAPIDQVWRVSALEFEHIDRWDANVKESRPQGAGVQGAPTGGRVCDLYSGGQTVERFVEFDEASCTFTYEITKGLPGFVVSARNTWSHDVVAERKTRLTMRIVMHVKGLLGFVMQGPMKAQMKKVLATAQEELKHFVETGDPHPRKRKRLKK